MQDTFPDAKPWPGGAPPAHHNAPPLEEIVTLDFDHAIAAKGLDSRVAEITEAAMRAPAVDNPDAAGKVGDLIAQAKAAKEAVEGEREVLNRPLLTAQRSLKGKADGLVLPMETVIAPLRTALDEFVAAAGAPISGEMGARVGTHTVYEFDILDFAKLPLAIRRHPDVVEAIKKVIRAHIRGGAREIAGVKIWAKAKATIR